MKAVASRHTQPPPIRVLRAGESDGKAGGDYMSRDDVAQQRCPERGKSNAK